MACSLKECQGLSAFVRAPVELVRLRVPSGLKFFLVERGAANMTGVESPLDQLCERRIPARKAFIHPWVLKYCHGTAMSALNCNGLVATRLTFFRNNDLADVFWVLGRQAFVRHHPRG
jgi:hypothetical protein